MNIIKSGLFCLALLVSATYSYAHGEKHHDMTPTESLDISAAFDTRGKLWRVGIGDGFVEVSKSEDLGKTFSKPVRANLEKQNISAHGELRPKIAIGKNGEIYVAWMQNLPSRFSGYIWLARSINGGKTFEKPFIVHQDRAEIGHGFEEINVAPNGDVTVLWLDARDLVAAKKAGIKRSGSSIYYAVSTDAGKTFAQEKKLADNSCECCRIATTSKPVSTGRNSTGLNSTGLNSTVVAMWRHVFDGSERDHNIAEIPKSGVKSEPHRATFGHWVIDGCPHHGAALATGGGAETSQGNTGWWGYHMAYFDGNDTKPGLYYSRMDGVAWVTSPAKKFGDNTRQAGHPALLSYTQKVGGEKEWQEKVWLVWREIKDSKSTIMGMHSSDGGINWDDAKTLANTSQKADYPFLLQHKNTAYLMWNTQQEGLQILPLSQ